MTKSSSIVAFSILFISFLLHGKLVSRADSPPDSDQVCQDNVCQSNEAPTFTSQKVMVDRDMCAQVDTEGKGSWSFFQKSNEHEDKLKKQPSTSIYQHGGTAQAFKPNVESSATICDPDLYRTSRHSVSTWSWFRWSTSRPPPVLNMKFTAFVCEVDPKSQCACQTLNLVSKHSGITDASIDIDVWQARPDGTFSSLRPGQEEGDCRGHAELNTKSSHVELQTVAPGSFGSLGGIVPSASYDWSPYGPPVLHVTVSAPKIMEVPLLVDLPMLIDSKTLERKSTSSRSDWRGASWMKKSFSQKPQSSSPIRIKSWKPRIKDNAIDIDIDVFLERKASSGDGLSVKTNATQVFCESWFYGLPFSFFLEPIAVCGPILLDFLAL